MFNALAERTGVAAEALNQLVAAQSPLEKAPVPAQATGAPRQRRPLDRPASSAPTNLAQNAIALLLHQPSLARQVTALEPLGSLEGDEARLLVELLQLLKRRPDSTTHMLLGHWYGAPEAELLNRLASQERLIPSEGVEKEFLDTIEKLAIHPNNLNFEAQVDKLKHRNYADISELEKLEIVQALREKHRRDEERGRKP